MSKDTNKSDGLTNIKDMTPNPALIKLLEDYLVDAKAGELRSMVAVIGWENNGVDHNWVLDSRNTERPLLSELVLLQADLVVNIGLKDGDSVLAKNLPDE